MKTLNIGDTIELWITGFSRYDTDMDIVSSMTSTAQNISGVVIQQLPSTYGTKYLLINKNDKSSNFELNCYINSRNLDELFVSKVGSISSVRVSSYRIIE